MARRYRTGLWILLLGLPVAVLVCAGLGAYFIAPWRIPVVLWHGLEGADVLLAIRFPRVVAGILVGAALGVSGAAMQGLFRNPLAAPDLLGVSNGAALGAALWIVLLSGGLSALSGWGLPFAAFIGAALAISLVWLIGTRARQGVTITLVLAGIAFNAVASAGVGALLYHSNDEQLRDITFWLLGGLDRSHWGSVLAMLPGLVVGLAVLASLGPALNALALGDREAQHLGFSIVAIRRRVIVSCALLVGTAVATAGGIAFVGLLVPHLLRLWRGPDQRWLLPASGLLGAILLLFADLAARTVVSPAELPVGIVTALFGGSFFVWLLLRRERRVIGVV